MGNEILKETVSGSPFIAHMMTQMNRIEEKVDGMQTALLTMARTEERVVQLIQSDNKKTEWILKLQERINDLEKSNVGTRAVSSRIERAVWIIVSAMLAIVVGWLMTHGVKP